MGHLTEPPAQPPVRLRLAHRGELTHLVGERQEVILAAKGTGRYRPVVRLSFELTADGLRARHNIWIGYDDFPIVVAKELGPPCHTAAGAALAICERLDGLRSVIFGRRRLDAERLREEVSRMREGGPLFEWAGRLPYENLLPPNFVREWRT